MHFWIKVFAIAHRRAPASLPADNEYFLICKALHKRKNWLFVGSDARGERAAAIYSLIETAKLNGLDSEAYLHAVLDCIADRVAELLPWKICIEPLQAAA